MNGKMADHRPFEVFVLLIHIGKPFLASLIIKQKKHYVTKPNCSPSKKIYEKRQVKYLSEINDKWKQISK